MMKELFTVIYCFRFTYCFCPPRSFRCNENHPASDESWLTAQNIRATRLKRKKTHNCFSIFFIIFFLSITLAVSSPAMSPPVTPQLVMS